MTYIFTSITKEKGFIKLGTAEGDSVRIPEDKFMTVTDNSQLVSIKTVGSRATIGTISETIYEYEFKPAGEKEVVLLLQNGTVERHTYNDGIIPSGACSNRNDIVEVKIGNGITAIADGKVYPAQGAFSKCSNLSKISLGNTLETIGISSFYECRGLTSITIPNSVTSINSYAFQNSALVNLEIPNSVTSIGSYAFLNCSGLTSVTIPNSVTTIGDDAFQRNIKLSSVTIPSSVIEIPSNCFSYCSGLTSVTIENGVTKIGGFAFRECYGISSITIPDSVIEISNAFKFNNLYYFNIGSGITKIYAETFYQGSKLVSITINATIPPTLVEPSYLDGSRTNNCAIYVPSESVEAYKAASGWSTYAARIQAIP